MQVPWLEFVTVFHCVLVHSIAPEFVTTTAATPPLAHTSLPFFDYFISVVFIDFMFDNFVGHIRFSNKIRLPLVEYDVFVRNLRYLRCYHFLHRVRAKARINSWLLRLSFEQSGDAEKKLYLVAWASQRCSSVVKDYMLFSTGARR